MRQVLLMLGAVALTATVSAQVTFTRHSPEEFGIGPVTGYTRNIFVDYNQDGHLDFFSNVIHLNDGTGHFAPLEATRITGWSLVDWADFDNDGYPDLLTTWTTGGTPLCTVYVLVYRNEGPPDWTLRDISDSLRLGRSYPIYDRNPADVAWLDYDNDGWLDIVVTGYEYPRSGAGKQDYLFRSHDGEYFSDVSEHSRIGHYWRCSRGASLLDYNEDGWVDVFFSVYRLQANLLHENNGDGTFWDVAEQKGVAGLKINGVFGHNIGTAVADFNNDGHLDMFSPITHHPGYPGDSTGHLWMNNGPPDWNFTCRFPGSGLVNTEIGSGPSAADFDNDGRVDLYYVNLYGTPGAGGWLFRNDGDCRFTDVTDAVGLGTSGGKYGALWVDITGNGFLDIFMSRYETWPAYSSSEIWLNSGNDNHWLQVDLVGRDVNRSAIGTRLDAFAGDLQVTREVLHNQGQHYGSTFIARQHFGLGPHTEVDSLIIRWPAGGGRQVERNLAVDTVLRIEQTTGIAESPVTRVETGRLELRTNGYQLEARLGNRTAIVVDAAGRVCGRLEPDTHGIARWQAASAGIYFVVAQDSDGRELQVGKAVLLR